MISSHIEDGYGSHTLIQRASPSATGGGGRHSDGAFLRRRVPHGLDRIQLRSDTSAVGARCRASAIRDNGNPQPRGRRRVGHSRRALPVDPVEANFSPALPLIGPLPGRGSAPERVGDSAARNAARRFLPRLLLGLDVPLLRRRFDEYPLDGGSCALGAC